MSSLGSKGKEVVGVEGSSDEVGVTPSGGGDGVTIPGVEMTAPSGGDGVTISGVTGDQLSSIVQNAVNVLWARKEAAAVVEAGRTEDRVVPRREEPMSELEKLQAEVREMKKRMSGQDVVKRRIPFKEVVMADDLPVNFRALRYDYDGTTDPWEHLCRFENSALLHRYTDGLPNDTIGSFDEFSSAFLHQFASSRKHQKTALTLFGIKQGEHEPLRGYVKRFNSAALDVPSATQEVLSSALFQGLQESDFFKSIAKRPAKNFDDLLARAEKYVNLEEAHKGKKVESREKRKDRVEMPSVGPKRFREPEGRPGLLNRAPDLTKYTPLIAPGHRC
ncbi:hypothetical protein DH2020_002604 [Rehmannia glutinosa]|uniref:Retrotransposon gag domain-containing protein n=1 Tax=Rehmannia glutinosa TaxID=99300 RepID=A0ABR0XUM6_REHGL